MTSTLWFYYIIKSTVLAFTHVNLVELYPFIARLDNYMVGTNKGSFYFGQVESVFLAVE